MEIKTLADHAAIQIAAYPVIGGKEKLKRFVKGKVLRQKLAPVDPFSWPNAMLGEGLLASYETTGNTQYLEAVADHLKRWKNAGYPIHYVDNIMNGSLALWIEALLSAGGKPKGCGSTSVCQPEREAVSARHAAESFKGSPQETLALCREAESACAFWLKKASCTGQGILPYRTQHPDWLFADTLGMVCPFLCRYGAENADEKLLRLGVSQLMQFWKKGMDPKTGLPYHGYDEKNGMKYGVIGWGRACGWMLKGMAESLPYIPKEWEEYEILAEAFGKLSDAVSGCQREDGGFSWQLEALEGHRDSSAEGMIGTALMRGMSTGLLPCAGGCVESKNRCADKESGHTDGKCEKPDDKCGCTGVGCGHMPERRQEQDDAYIRSVLRLSSALQQSVLDGMVKDCSGECKGFAEYPQIYGSYPWGSGSALEFFALTEKL